MLTWWLRNIVIAAVAVEVVTVVLIVRGWLAWSIGGPLGTGALTVAFVAYLFQRGRDR